MTAQIYDYLHRRVLYNLFPALEIHKIELPGIAAFSELLKTDTGGTLTCTCCSWKGAELKARKHYLVAGTIAELEFFCPKCNQYLGFISEATAINA